VVDLRGGERVLGVRRQVPPLGREGEQGPAALQDVAQPLVVEACRAEAAAAPADGEARLAALRADREKLTRQIQFILDNPGEAEADRREAEQTLRRLRAERARQAAAIGALEAARARPRAVPTEAEVRQALAEPGAILAAAEADGDVLFEAREVVRLVTGGRIELAQLGERLPQRGWLRGRFRPRLVAAVAGRLGVSAGAAAPAAEVVIGYRRTVTAEDEAEQAKALYDGGMTVRAITRELGSAGSRRTRRGRSGTRPAGCRCRTAGSGRGRGGRRKPSGWRRWTRCSGTRIF
jgi:hypothetical protein